MMACATRHANPGSVPPCRLGRRDFPDGHGGSRSVSSGYDSTIRRAGRKPMLPVAHRHGCRWGEPPPTRQAGQPAPG